MAIWGRLLNVLFERRRRSNADRHLHAGHGTDVGHGAQLNRGLLRSNAHLNRLLRSNSHLDLRRNAHLNCLLRCHAHLNTRLRCLLRCSSRAIHAGHAIVCINRSLEVVARDRHLALLHNARRRLTLLRKATRWLTLLRKTSWRLSLLSGADVHSRRTRNDDDRTADATLTL